MFLAGKPHEQRSLAGYSPEDHRESDTTKHTGTTGGLGCQEPHPLMLVCYFSMFSFTLETASNQEDSFCLVSSLMYGEKDL